MSSVNNKVRDAYNAYVLFFGLHFFDDGGPKDAPPEVLAACKEVSAQRALDVAIGKSAEVLGVYKIQSKQERPQIDLFCSLIELNIAAADFLKWASTWVNFVLPILKQPNGQLKLVRSPSEFKDSHQLLCSMSASRLASAWHQFATRYHYEKIDGDEPFHWPKFSSN